MGNIRKCSFCGKEKYYAKGLCRNCYTRYITRGTVEYYEHPTTSWYERNKEKCKEKSKKYRKKYPEKVTLAKAKWEEKNKESRKEYKKQWYLKNRERILEKCRMRQING